MRIDRLPAGERPRERCRRLGPSALSAVELLAVVLGSGGSRGSALELAASLLEEFCDLGSLAEASCGEIAARPGLGPARAVALAAALELGRRAMAGGSPTLSTVSTPEQAVALFRPLLAGRRQEVVAALYLGGRHQALQLQVVAVGELNAAGVHPREVFRPAVGVGAAALVLAHNHPSGDCEPSEDDIRLTRRLARCGETLGIELLDHLVLGGGEHVSLRERGIL